MAAETKWPEHRWTVEDAQALAARCREGLTPEDLKPFWPEEPERPKLTLIAGGKKS